MYINGTFFLVGSYKAFCRDLFGVGNDGYAWDGFLIGLRGYNLTVANLLTKAPSTNQGGTEISIFGAIAAAGGEVVKLGPRRGSPVALFYGKTNCRIATITSSGTAMTMNRPSRA